MAVVFLWISGFAGFLNWSRIMAPGATTFAASCLSSVTLSTDVIFRHREDEAVPVCGTVFEITPAGKLTTLTQLPENERRGLLGSCGKAFRFRLANPRIIETGMDLISHPSLSVYESGYSPHALRQVSKVSVTMENLLQCRPEIPRTRQIFMRRPSS